MSRTTAIITDSAEGTWKTLARNGFNVAINDLPSEKAKLVEVVNEVVFNVRLVSDFGSIDTVVGIGSLGPLPFMESNGSVIALWLTATAYGASAVACWESTAKLPKPALEYTWLRKDRTVPTVLPTSFWELARCPLPQGIGQPEDAASVGAYLASKEAHCISERSGSIRAKPRTSAIASMHPITEKSIITGAAKSESYLTPSPIPPSPFS
ncbi:hypothetical protein EV421DRAFT_2021764 [Armillaria borealis]|uniref:NAD(P)-binding protein n=1 Tax=Armillaria borealis TaxID=47425 RepID=A0AA39J8L1_9AGAR|nr:hypothetical protein EV421DRAFT_2021764 [Armillaria borealis]